jgi:hypothetical protein
MDNVLKLSTLQGNTQFLCDKAIQCILFLKHIENFEGKKRGNFEAISKKKWAVTINQ